MHGMWDENQCQLIDKKNDFFSLKNPYVDPRLACKLPL